MEQDVLYQLIKMAIPIIVPLMIAYAKPILGGAPKRFVPFIAMFLGMAVDIIGSLVAGMPLDVISNMTEGGALGLTGVGVREVVKKRPPDRRSTIEYEGEGNYLNKGVSGSLMLCLMFVFLTGCATIMLRDDPESTKESRAVADYLAAKDTLSNVSKDIKSICPSLPDLSCRKAKRVFNYTVDVYKIAGDYIKAVIDPANTAEYVSAALHKTLALAGKEEHDSEIKTIIDGIVGIVKATEETNPEIKVLEILQVFNDDLISTIASILEEVIVKEGL